MEAPCPMKNPNTPARIADAIAIAAVVGGGRSPGVMGDVMSFSFRRILREKSVLFCLRRR